MRQSLLCFAALATASLPGLTAAQTDVALPQPVQLRLLENSAARTLRAEVDLGLGNFQVILAISDSDALMRSDRMPVPFLPPQMMLPMTRQNDLTYAVTFSTEGWPVDRGVYLQAVVSDDFGDMRFSGVAPYQVCVPEQICRPFSAERWTGVPLHSWMLCVTRMPPTPSSMAVEISFMARSNDWGLAHVATVRDQHGTYVYLIVKEPGPGEGRLDMTELHQITVDLGPGATGEIFLLAARTQTMFPDIGSVKFQIPVLEH